MTDSTSYDLISADSHVIEPPDLFEKGLPAGLRDRAPKMVPLGHGSAWLVDGTDPVPLPPSAATGSGYRLPTLDGAPRVAATFEEVLPGLYDPAERLKLQDADSVTAEILYPSPDLWDAIKQLDDADLKLACVRAYNDWIAEFDAHSPDRLVGLGKIPFTNRQDAQDELVRCVTELDLQGVILDVWPGGAGPGDPEDEPFWNTVNELDVPVSIHYAIGSDVPTAPPSGVDVGLTPPMADTTVPLLTSGVFDRCPKVRLVFAHGDAGWAFHWLEFMDAFYLRRRHLKEFVLPNEDLLPSEYIRRHFWFTFHEDRTAVRNREKVGTSHLLWSSSFPLDAANWPDDREQAMRVTQEVPAGDRHALLGKNTASLYRLPGHDRSLAENKPLVSLVHF